MHDPNRLCPWSKAAAGICVLLGLTAAAQYGLSAEQPQKAQKISADHTVQIPGGRSGGSIILLGLGTQPGRVNVPETTRTAAKRIFAIFDLRSEQYQKLEITGGTVEVRPRRVTVVDCGSARHGPKP